MAQAQTFDETLVAAAATAPISSAQAQAAKAELVRMRASLARWLKYRTMNDALAAGANVPQPLLKNPRAHRAPAAVIALRLAQGRRGDEAELAAQLHQLLSEVFDAATLPDPDTTKNPKAAVQLAQIAISGAVPGESARPAAAGFVWLWPLVIIVGALVFVIATAIKTNADAAAERERLECIKSGACTDYGFWLKVGAIGFISWFAWDRMGVGDRVKKLVKGRGA